MDDTGSRLRVVDFHSHFVPAALARNTYHSMPPAQRDFWEGVHGRLTGGPGIVPAMDRAGVSVRVLSCSPEFLRAADGTMPDGDDERANDALAALVSGSPSRLCAMATVDGYAGERGAKELERAVRQLGLGGVFFESASGDLLPDAPEARDTLTAAAELGVPVFLHPVPDAELKRRFRGCRSASERFVRGTINSAAVIAMLEGGLFEELPRLRVVVTSLAVGGLLLAECLGAGARLGVRRNLFVDTTGLHPTMLRTTVDLLGADRIVTGTDWPVVTETDLPARLQATLGELGLSRGEQEAIAGATAAGLLGLH